MLDLAASFFAPPAAGGAAAADAAASLARGARAGAENAAWKARAAVINSERALATIAADAAAAPRTAAPFAALIPGNSAAEVALTSGLQSFLSLYNAAVVARLVLTWIPAAPEAIVTPLATVVDPALNLFRGLIPPIGAIDVSPILFFVLLDFLQNGATALPCEMPKEGSGKGGARPVRARAGRALRLLPRREVKA